MPCEPWREAKRSATPIDPFPFSSNRKASPGGAALPHQDRIRENKERAAADLETGAQANRWTKARELVRVARGRVGRGSIAL